MKVEPVEHGETGELYLAGVGLAEGYNQPTLTETVFLTSKKLGRLYKTVI